jgi:hypothetical protein
MNQGDPGDPSDKIVFRNAYQELQMALVFRPGDLAVQQKMDEAYQSAVINVVVLPLEETGYRFSAYNGPELRNFDETLLRNLTYNTSNLFVKYYSAREARSRNIRADQWIETRFSNMDMGRYHDAKSTRQVSKEVLVKETVYRPDSVVKEYAKVTAQVTTIHRTMRSEGLLQVRVRDTDGRWLWTDQFTGRHNWSTEFATYTGDARALDEADKLLVNRRAEHAPFEDEIMRCIMNELDNTVFCRIRDYYHSR